MTNPILSLKQLQEWEPPAVPEVISSGILYQGTRMLLFGKYKSFKSMLAIHTGFTIASGRRWFGYSTHKRRVLIVQSEIPQFLYKQRIVQYTAGTNNYPDNIYFWYTPYLKLDKPTGIDQLRSACSTIQPDVLILDPLYKFVSGVMEASHDVSLCLDNIDRMKDEFNLTPIIVHHETKDIRDTEGGKIDRGSQSVHGSIFIMNWIDTAVRIERNPGKADSREAVLSFTDCRNATAELEDIHCRLNGDCSWTKLEEVTLRDAD